MKFILRALTVFFTAASLILSVSLYAADNTALTEGTIKKIDAPGQRVMLAHGPIANLGMAPMTMMFKVKDPAMLKKLKEGDKVRFRAEDLGGDYTIVRIEAAR
jgi:Cu(I)/Ag(I) efflux system protein CusF